MTIEFKGWPKISRWYSERVVVTEKIDGTNACVVLLPNEEAPFGFEYAAQSRTRLLTPESDNFGFAQWVYSHVDELWTDLGPGYHYGEWAGAGIQRRYGMNEKKFFLFDAHRWVQRDFEQAPWVTPNLDIVPYLYEGYADGVDLDALYHDLRTHGSYIADFDNPEGIVAHFKDSGKSYKITDAVQGKKVHLDG